MKKYLTKIIFTLLSILVLTEPINIFAKNQSEIALGSSLSQSQRDEVLSYFGELGNDNFITIDGNKVNEHLNNGSDNSVGIFSSAKVEFKNSGYGVHVYIVTPENITKVSENMYRNAAIVAGVNNVDIQIAAPQAVTGEGALAGVYEIFAQHGMVLDSSAIQLGEKQVQLEQFLAENTSLSTSQISKLITKLNLAVVTLLEEKSEFNKDEIITIVENLVKGDNYDFNNDVMEQLIQHALSFSQSDVAKDPETKKALESALASYEDLEDVFSKEFKVYNGTIKINEVRILQPGQENNIMDYPILSIWYDFTLDDNADPTSAMIAWIDSVVAIQDNDPNFINELMIDVLPDEKYLDSQMQDLKPGGTAENAVSYRLSDDLETVVQLKFYDQQFSQTPSDEIVLNISGLN